VYIRSAMRYTVPLLACLVAACLATTPFRWTHTVKHEPRCIAGGLVSNDLGHSLKTCRWPTRERVIIGLFGFQPIEDLDLSLLNPNVTSLTIEAYGHYAGFQGQAPLDFLKNVPPQLTHFTLNGITFSFQGGSCGVINGGFKGVAVNISHCAFTFGTCDWVIRLDSPSHFAFENNYFNVLAARPVVVSGLLIDRDIVVDGSGLAAAVATHNSAPKDSLTELFEKLEMPKGADEEVLRKEVLRLEEQLKDAHAEEEKDGDGEGVHQ